MDDENIDANGDANNEAITDDNSDDNSDKHSDENSDEKNIFTAAIRFPSDSALIFGSIDGEIYRESLKVQEEEDGFLFFSFGRTHA